MRFTTSRPHATFVTCNRKVAGSYSFHSPPKTTPSSQHPLICEVCQHRATAALLYKIRSEAAARGDSEARIVHQMALAPQSQGQGLGAHYFRLYSESYRNPTYGVVTTAPTPNSRRSFWRALGFKEVGTIRLDASELDGGLGAEVLHPEEWQWALMRHMPRTHKPYNHDQP
jgi:hypothetical protein